MTDLVDPGEIELIVGAPRHPYQHIGRAVSDEETVYILHSQRCKDSTEDLCLCPYSKALDQGIDVEDWIGYEDRPVFLVILSRGLFPVPIERQRARPQPGPPHRGRGMPGALPTPDPRGGWRVMTERTYPDHGFAQHQPIPCGTTYGGTVRVYESSSAAAPRLWLHAELRPGEEVTLHLSMDAARALIADLSDLVRYLDGGDDEGGER